MVQKITIMWYLFLVRFFVFCFFLSQGFSVALEAVLILALVDQVGLERTEICLLLPPSAGIKGVRHHCPALVSFETVSLVLQTQRSS